ncbi:MAG: hypothetical protein K0S12_2296 [Bacteroidetes bacterium]|jgi:DUF1365 family protein|nr:hypothetical protein [Bacteroidota bacterium]
MTSSLYKASVMHNRLAPKPHRFHYNVFMFYLDLDELGTLSKRLTLFSRNKFNFFSFRDSEHLQLPAGNPDTTKNTKQHIIDYLKDKGFNYTGQRIMILTNLNILGYNFNPVSFYYVFNSNNEVECAIAEVSNTFREMKPYFMGKDLYKDNKFHLNTTKYFYVSPFIDHDTNFDFNLYVPGDKLNIRIDDYKDGERFFISTLTGTKKPLTNANLLWYSVRFPFLTLRIMGLIHWNALLLWLKKIPFHKKSAFPELQKDVHRKYKDR